MPIVAVAAAAAAGTFPITRFASLQESILWTVAESAYENGWSQRAALVSAPRRAYQLSMRLQAPDAEAVEAFYASKGQHGAFYFLSPREGTMRIVRFTGPLERANLIGGRSQISCQLLEIA